jgi:hypothetical protein
MSVGQDLLDVPFPEMISKLGLAIAQSQHNMDQEGIEILKIMGDKELAPVTIPNYAVNAGDHTLVPNTSDDIVTSMIGAGFQPTFYQFAETIIEVKMAITMTRTYTTERTTQGTETQWWRTSKGVSVRSTPVNAKYSSTYNYTAEGSSLLRTRLVPVPPNPFIQKILEMRAQAMQLEFELKLKAVELAVQKAQDKNNEEIQKQISPT